MVPSPFQILYREFLFRFVDVEVLSKDARGDSRQLFGQLASLLIFCSVLLGIIGACWAGGSENENMPAFDRLISAWTMEHFLIATTMLVVGLFAVLSWESLFLGHRDLLVLGHLPIPVRTLLFAKVAATVTAVGIAAAALHGVAGLIWPFALAVKGRLIRSFVAYWVAAIAAAVFTFSAVLGIQGLVGCLLPRRWFLRISTYVQLGVFCALIAGYFLQPSPATVLLKEPHQHWLAWAPSFWFLGLYQQVSGSLPPTFAPFAVHGWLALSIGVFAAAIAYGASYVRGIQRILEQPHVSPAPKTGWMPYLLGHSFGSAIALFSVRTLFRSSRHRLLFAFFAGVGCAFALLFLRSPAQIAGPGAGDPWAPLSIPLLASTLLITGCCITGLRTVFSLPVQLPANWIFRVIPIAAGRKCLRARRRALLILGVAPPWFLSAMVLLFLWPWQSAGLHLVLLALLGIIFAEVRFDSVQRLPFACSYLPGKSNLHITFWFWLYLAVAGTIGASIEEREILKSGAGSAILLASLALIALFLILRNEVVAADPHIELRFEEIPDDKLVTLGLS